MKKCLLVMVSAFSICPAYTVNDFTVYAKTSLAISDRVKNTGGLIGSNASCIVGNDAEVKSSVYCAGAVTLRDRVRVKGDIFAGRAVT